jgi:hypothetical protein
MSRYKDGFQAGQPIFYSWQAKEFSLLHNVKIGLGANQTSCPVGIEGSSLRLQWPVHEPYHSYVVSRSRMVEIYLHLSYIFMSWYLIKHRNNVCFLLLSYWYCRLQIQRPRFCFPALSDFVRSSGSETGSTQPREDN